MKSRRRNVDSSEIQNAETYTREMKVRCILFDILIFSLYIVQFSKYIYTHLQEMLHVDIR